MKGFDALSKDVLSIFSLFFSQWQKDLFAQHDTNINPYLSIQEEH